MIGVMLSWFSGQTILRAKAASDALSAS